MQPPFSRVPRPEPGRETQVDLSQGADRATFVLPITATAGGFRFWEGPSRSPSIAAQTGEWVNEMSRGPLSGLLLIVVSLAWTLPTAAQAPSQSSRERGKAIYNARCAVCHGGDGRADTPVGRMLKPPPRNFADTVEMARVTVDRMYQAIKEGRPGTAMAAWGQVLTETEIGDVIDHIHSLAPPRASTLSAEQLSVEVGRRIYTSGSARSATGPRVGPIPTRRKPSIPPRATSPTRLRWPGSMTAGCTRPSSWVAPERQWAAAASS